MAAKIKRTRMQNADEIATGAIVFVRRARREGCVNTVSELLLWETAQELNITEFSISTVKRLVLERAALMNELDLIDFAPKGRRTK